MLQTDEIEETFELMVFEMAFEEVDLEAVREDAGVVPILELLDFEIMLLGLMFEDELIFGNIDVLKDELVEMARVLIDEESFGLPDEVTRLLVDVESLVDEEARDDGQRDAGC